jgi:hypothetical protein
METFFTDMDILSLQISMKLCPVGQYLIRVHEIAYGFDGPSENNVSFFLTQYLIGICCGSP